MPSSSMRCFKSFFQHTWHPQQHDKTRRSSVLVTRGRGAEARVIPGSMKNKENRHTRNYGYAFDNMVIVPSPGSIWDYPYLNQVSSMMCLVYGTRPDPQQDFFPPKTRIPEPHMESPSRFELTKTESPNGEETELGEVKSTMPSSSVAAATQVQPGSIPCRNGGCKSWTSRGEPRLESPWHVLKTIFLVSVIVALVLWVIVYTFLAQYRIL